MKITSVRCGRLKSLPGYNNVQLQAEAAIEPGDDPAAIRADLDLWVQAQLETKGVDDLRSEAAELEYRVGALERAAESLDDRIAHLTAQRDQLKLELTHAVMVEVGPLADLSDYKLEPGQVIRIADDRPGREYDGVVK